MVPSVVFLAAIFPLLHCLESNIRSDEFIQMINEIQDAWTAGPNFHEHSYVKNLLSALPNREEKLPLQIVDVKKRLPDDFDGRQSWKRCRSVGRVKEQGNCASAWALVATGVFSDRMCISKVSNVEVSAQNVLSCCRLCGVNCFGGYVSEALAFLARSGAPSKKCHPYELYGCPKIQGLMSCPEVRAYNPRCRGYCRPPYPKRPFQDLHQATGAYSIANNSDVIMSEIISKGPVAAVMDVYEDLMVYKSGVYSYTAGRQLGQHPVKVVGWGEDQGRPYWLVVNTWGSLWGDKGVLKIARKTNGCNLEKRVFGLSP
ncbi:cathepsin B-like [Macrosteles quadrilineatus]|uniref:cathepsin B-like n=1 Tax=Macrosteles quadrilineatus TaxID=74068 RepID=UPI0023E0D652|nr:cathepsin B-like [Macrosteles quadrilineatus]